MQKVYNIFYPAIVILLMFKPSSGFADEKITLAYIDSVSLHYFQVGNWDELINTGKLAEENNINFKWLQQRVGYALFNKKQYYKSMQHYENALAFDKNDEITHLYLYYIGINTGAVAYARYHAGKLSDDYKAYIQQKKIRTFFKANTFVDCALFHALVMQQLCFILLFIKMAPNMRRRRRRRKSCEEPAPWSVSRPGSPHRMISHASFPQTPKFWPVVIAIMLLTHHVHHSYGGW